MKLVCLYLLQKWQSSIILKVEKFWKLILFVFSLFNHVCKIMDKM